MACIPRTPINHLSVSCTVACLLSLSFLPLGCGTGIAPGSTSHTPSSPFISGTVHGGQQPVAGAHVFLYAAGTSAGGPSRSMLKSPGYVSTDVAGDFDITGDYTCAAGDQVYLLALGGDAGGGANPAIGLMAALGPCSALTSSTTVSVNEVTTVASIYALSNFITSPTAVAADSPNANALAAAFSNVKALADVSTGIAPATVLGSAVVPQATINSLANSIAACINSTLQSNTCSSLFSDTNTSQSSDTAQATINIAHAPASNAAAIFALAGSKPPFAPTLQNAPSAWTINPLFPADVLTYHNNVARTGVQPAETVLTPANVTSATFGKLRTFAVDGYLYAQPLVTGALGMPDGNLHNIVFAATAHASIYAFDANGNNPSAGYLWKRSLFAAGEAPVLTADYGNCNDTVPESSLLGTPVIDRSTGTLYVVSTEKITASGTFTQKIHALSLLDGSEKFGGPTIITATYPGTGSGAGDGTGNGTAPGILTFDALKQNQRPALLLSNGNIWITWASHCDHTYYHGYVIAYSAADVTKQTALFNNTPNGNDGGIWMSGGGPSADADGYVYVVAGNGKFDANTGGLDYGDGGLKLAPLTPGSETVTVAAYFVPYNQQTLSDEDADVGVTNAMLFDDPGGKAPHLMVESDKTGKIYLLDTSTMGGYTGPSGPNADVEDISTNHNIFNNFSYFNKTMYVGASGAPLAAYAFQPGSSSAAGQFNKVPTSQTATTPGGSYPNGGACPVVSANGSASAIVWMQEHTGANGKSPAMKAYDAANLATEFYDTNQAAANRDVAPSPVKFTCPVVANGLVFVGGQSALAVYGLLP